MLKRAAQSIGVVASVLLGAVAPESARPTPPVQLSSLNAVYERAAGGVRDTNSDDLADTIVARVIVPEHPASEDVEAAANIAARLGYETIAATLPIVVRDTEVRDGAGIALPILVGRENRYLKASIGKGAIDVTSLTPGQGLITLVASPLGGPDGVAVVGSDDSGTLAAGIELAARLPRLWNMTGITLSGIEQQALAYLKNQRIDAAGAAVTSLVVSADGEGLATVGLRVRVRAADRRRAVTAFEELETAHRFGREPRTLNFAQAASTTITILANGEPADRVVVRRSSVNLRAVHRPERAQQGGAGSLPSGGGGSAPEKVFDLSTLYSLNGWFDDVYQDLIPDRVTAGIVVGAPEDSLGAAHIAARLGLETTGITLPISKRDDSVRQPQNEPNPILVGRGNTFVQRLATIGKARLDDLQSGEGTVQVVPRALGQATATVVAGADPAGTDAASLYLARRLPYLWETRRGSPTIEDVTREADRFFSGRSSAGQAAQALQAVQVAVDELVRRGKALESIDVALYIEKADQDVAKFFEQEIRKTAIAKDATVSVSSHGITDPVTVFDEKLEIPWEVDDFWAAFTGQVLPNVKTGANVELEARLSEPPEVRQQITEEAVARLMAAGAVKPRVRVLSAFKQGFSWLTEQVLPDLKGKNAKSLHLKVRELKPDPTTQYVFQQLPTRWLQELFPADEIFKRDLGLPVEAFRMELVEDGPEVYRLEATDGAGRVIYTSSFTPKIAQREYIEQYPGWSRVDVTTGWIAATVDGRSVIDLRIETDPERFWNHYQSGVLPRVRDYILRTTDSRPTVDKRPFFRDLEVEVWMSEPDYLLGVDQEHISSTESLHQDIFFVAQDFFNAMGRATIGQPLSSAGRVLPIMHPSRPGKPGEAHIRFAGNAAARAKLDITYKEKGAARAATRSHALGAINVEAARALRVIARADRVSEIELQVAAKDDAASLGALDALDNLLRLQRAGILLSTFSYQHVDRVAVAVTPGQGATQRRVVLHTGRSEPTRIHASHEKPSHPIVTWDHIISPDESERIVRQLSYYPSVSAYKVGESYRGRDISMLEVTLPTPSEIAPVSKRTAFKPTLYVVGRQHGNEVSSTGHILRLGELLASDPGYREIAKKVNVILCPVQNPDGATVAYELQELTPNHMLHAGRPSSLGSDVGARGLLPEADVDGRISREWLPDIYLNAHGASGHEVVRQFSGYMPPTQSPYSMLRGWFSLAGGIPLDPRFPEGREVLLTLRDAIDREVSGNADVYAMNKRAQDRYIRWGYGFAPHIHPMEVYRDTMLFYSDPESGQLLGIPRTGLSGNTPGMNANAARAPHITLDGGTTEAPDETVHGERLETVTRAGFSFLMAHAKYLRDGQYSIQRIEENAPGGATLTTLRVRPVMPGRKPTTNNERRH